MAIIARNDGGKSFDTTTAPFEIFNLWQHAPTIQNDVVVGNYIDTGTGTGFSDNVSIPCNWIGSSDPRHIIWGARMKWNKNNGGAGAHVNVNCGDANAGIGILCNSSNSFQVVGGLSNSPITPALPFDPSINWHYYEFEIVVGVLANSSTFKVFLDGVNFFTQSGINVYSGVGPFSSFNSVKFANSVKLTDFYAVSQDGGPTLPTSMLGPVIVAALFPTSDTGPNTFHNGFGGTHFSQVNAVVPNLGTTFVDSNINGNQELYGFNTLPINANKIYDVSGKLSSQSVGGASSNLLAMLYQTVGHQGAPFGVAIGGYNEYQPDSLFINPVSGLPWTVTDINSLKGGFQLLG